MSKIITNVNVFIIILISLLGKQDIISQTKIVNDFGDEDDTLQTSDIYFERYWWEDNYNIPGDEANFIHQETADSFWVFTTAPDTPGLIKSRTIRMTTNVEIFTKPIAQGDTIYLGIRYKDNLPTVYGGTPVYSWNGSGWILLDSLGGKFDHKWKVKIILIAPQNLSVENDRYKFKIGEGIWSRGLTGFLSIDRIELAVSQSLLTVEADTPGFYPITSDDKFSNMNKDSSWNVNGKPFFPIGLAAGWTGMSRNFFQKTADAGFNTLVFYNWMDIYNPYAAGNVWDILPSEGHYGFTEFLDECQTNGLKAIGVFQNDIKYYPVQTYFRSEKNCLDYIKNSIKKNKNHPALLAWSPVDEPDHSFIPDFYAPLEWVLSVKKAIREADPNHPLFALEVGWRKGAFGHFKDIADFQGFDIYPEYGESLAGIANGLDQLAYETNNEKPYICYLKAYERTSEQAYMSMAEAYLALIHGANGIFYWALQDAEPIWNTLSQIANEIDSLNDILLPPAKTLDINGKNNLCSNNSDQIENTLKLNGNGVKYILSTNLENSTINNVQFTVEGLEADKQIEVLFENRTIISGTNSFIDNFKGYERHVYKFSNLTGIGLKNKEKIPIEFALFQNYPNPFNPTTTIKYSIPLLETLHATSLQNTSTQQVQLIIYNILGKEVETLVNNQKSGTYKITWNAANQPSGIYFYRITAGKFSETKQMILMK